MNTVSAELVCVFSGVNYTSPISINVDTGAIISIDESSSTPPENASIEREYVIYDEEIFHLVFDVSGNYYITPSDLDDFQAHVMG